MKYVVMIEIELEFGWGEQEYSGTYYNVKEHAEEELQEARNDGNYAWIEYYNYCGRYE